MKFRSFLCLILVFCLLFCGLPPVSAANASGTWGKNITWEFDAAAGRLVISGSGEMPNSDTTPDWYSFRDQIRSAEIRSGITNVGPICFYDCKNLVSVSIPGSVTYLGSYAFGGCLSLKGVSLPSGLKGVGSNAFDGCRSLSSIDLPASIRAIGSLAFRGCESLTQVTMHPGLQKIGTYAFTGLPITSIDVPDTVTSIGDYAFAGASLSKIHLSDALETIGSRAFASCPFLKTITLPASMRFVASDAFLDTELKTLVVLSTGCTFEDFGGTTYTVLGSENTTVYGYPGSTVERFINGDPNTMYSFRPIYFDDVAPGKWYFESVVFAKENGLFNGVGKRAFAPEQPMTRAMIVQVLYNLAGDGEICENRFSDVPDKAWYARAVAWAAEYGIVNGMRPGVFDPNANVTREQIAGIVWRFTQQLGISVEGAGDLSGFPDQDKIGNWAQDAMAWAVDRGIIGGSRIAGTDYLQPKAFATRAQVAAIMMRCVKHWDDATCNYLRVGVANMGLQPCVEQAAQAFMAEHGDVRIEVCQSDVMTYDETIRYRFGEDVILLMGRENLEQFSKSGTTGRALLSTPFVFATTQNGASVVKDVPEMIRKLGDGQVNLCLCRRNTPARAYGDQLLAENGVEYYDEDLFEYEDSVYAVEFSLSFGLTRCGTVTEHVAKISGLHVLEDSRRDGREDLLCAYYPEELSEKEILKQFLDYLSAGGEPFGSCGLYPLREE